MEPAQAIICPKCGTSKVWKDGNRYRDGFKTQKYACANPNCLHHFVEEQNDYKLCKTIPKRHVSVNERMKNMASELKIQTVPEGNTNQQITVLKAESEIKSLLFDFKWYMTKQNFKPETIRTNDGSLRALIIRNANLFDPESVKEVLATGRVINKDGTLGRNWSANRKRNIIIAYTLFLKTQKLTWEPPKCEVVRKIPFIPTEHEIDQLIAGMPTRVATFLQLLKETAMRSGEACSLLWTDIDLENQIITLNTPEKGSLPRQWSNKGDKKQLSRKLLDMLEALPKESEKVFPYTMYSLKNTFVRSRRKLSNKLQNSRLIQIHFHTLRHWKATMEYHNTKDLLHVMAFLGHKKSENTLLYVQLDEKLFADKSNDQWIVKAVHTEEEAIAAGEVGFEPYLIINGVQLVRKRK